jgi:ADP-ribose pyrophosphatase
MKFELLVSDLAYQGRAFTVRCDTLRNPDGRETRFDIVEHVDSVIILPLEADGHLLFVRQYRHAVGLDLLELPAGTLEDGEVPEECAKRELREETGMAAGKLESLGGFYLAPGYSTEYMHVYVATELHNDPLESDADEFLTVERIPVANALLLCEQGEIPDAKTLAAILLARKNLEKQ